MFNFMKHKDKKEKEDKKREKKEKKEREKKEKNREPVTQDELNRLEEVKKGVFRRASDRNPDKHRRTEVRSAAHEAGDGMKKGSSDSSLTSSSGRPSPMRELPLEEFGFNRTSTTESTPVQTSRKPPALMPKPKSILKSVGESDVNVSGNIDDRHVLQENTKLNQNMFGEVASPSKKPKPAPRTQPKREGLYGGTGEEHFEPPPTSPIPTEKTFHVKLRLPAIAPTKSPRIRELILKRQSAGDFGFTLRKGIMSEKENGSTEIKKSVIFAEPGNYSRSIQTGLIPGDRLVEVNNINVEMKPREDIVEIIRNSGDSVTLKVQPIPELVELSVRPSSEGGLIDVQESMAKGGTLKRSGSVRYKKGARSETEVQSEKAWLDAERVWLVHKGGFASASMLKENSGPALPEGRVRIRLDHGGDVLEVDEDDVEKANSPQFDRAEDLASLRYLNESSVLHTLRQRYGANLLHTYMGQSMVIINPMHQLSIYSEKVIQMFKGCKQEDMPPHIFAAGQITFREMVNSRSDQSIVMTGRSGSGKSANSKHILHYLTATAGSLGNVLTVEKLNAVLILLEAFGNSRTILNTNASRFSQITTLDFDHSGQIASASIQALLFEKTRVVRRPEGEPTFHIFYQMLAGLDSQLRTELQLNVLNEPNLFMTPLQRNEDRQRAITNWAKVVNSFEVLGIVDEEIRALCTVLAAIYHLGVAGAIKGNNNKSQFARPAASQKAATLLGISVEELARQIFTSSGTGSLSRTTSMRVSSPRDATLEANTSGIENLEGFIIGLYSDVFNAVVSLINRSLSSNYRSATSITVVDPQGFQNPATCGRQTGASFEDLCHNYMQERLQLLNHDLTFTVQQDRYSQENIECDFEFVTTSPTALVALIDKPSQQTLVRNTSMDQRDAEKKGLLWILDEESIFPGATEDSFMDRFFNHHGEQKVRRDSLLRKASSLGNTFILNHFQGTNPVQYNASGWLKVCRENPVTRVATQVLQESKKSNISQLFNSVKAPIAGMVSGSIAGMEGSTTLRRVGSMRRTFMSGTAGLKKRSACLQVKFQVDSIIETIRKTKCHFIHCVLPQHNAGLCDLRGGAAQGKTDAADDNLMNVTLVRSQLRGSEVLDTVRIYRQGFPDFIGFGEFRQRFQGLIPAHSRPSKDMEDKQAMSHLLENLDIDKLNYRIGLSQIFFRAGALNQLELAREEKITGRVVVFQAYCRGFLGRKNLEKLRVKQLAVSCIQRNVKKFMQIRDWEWWKLYTKVKPLLNVHRTEEELRAREEELEQLKAKLEKIEKERNEYKLQCDRLDNKLSEITADYAEVHTASNQAGELLESEQAERMRLEKELKDIQGKYNTLKRHSEKQEMQMVQMHLWQAQMDGEMEEDVIDGSDSVYKERYEKILREMEFTKKRLQHQHDEELEQEQANKKSLEKRIHEAMEDAEEQRRLVMAAKKKSQRLASEMQDMKLHLEEQMTRNNDLERKQRRFDTELAKSHEETRNEKSMKEKLQRDKDEIMSEKISGEQQIQRLKMDVDSYREKSERFDREISDLTMTSKDDHELLGLKRARTELEIKIKDQEEELDEQAGQIQQLEQTKLRLEMNIEKSRQHNLKELEEKEEELEEMRSSTQKKLKQLNIQLEEEYEEKKGLMTEKRELERQLHDLGGQKMSRDKEVERRLRRDLRKTKALLRDAEVTLQKQRSGEGTKTTIKQLRNQLDDAEYASATATKAKKTMELEIQDLQQQLEDIFRVKQESENRSMVVLREKSDLQSQLEENEEDMAELMKKFKAVVSQQSIDHMTISDQLQQIDDLQQERDKLKQEISELSMQVTNFEETSVDKHTVTRLENKIRDLEAKLDLEEATRHRTEVHLTRTKEQLDKLGEEKEHLVSTKLQADDSAKQHQRQLRDLRDEFSDVQKREMEISHKNKELESKINELEGDFEQNQSDLKLAFRRISDLQSALEDELDSGSLLSDSEDDLEDDDLDSDIDSLLESHKHSPRLRHRGRDSGNISSPMSPLSSQSFDAEPSSPIFKRTGSTEA
ncbi:hypothetical protein ScPMuIL_005917 [Solemya velum]